MPKSVQFSQDMMKLVFNATGIAGIADNAASAPNASFYLSLHTADPTLTGNQSSSEVAYTGYARVAVPRDAADFAVAAKPDNTGAQVTTPADIKWPASGGGAAVTATHIALGTASTGTGKILYVGPVDTPMSIGPGNTPTLTAGTVIFEG